MAVRVAAIWRVVARIAERSFRRGFQHGWEFSRRRESLKYDVAKWRFFISEDESPEMLGGRIVSAVERLRVQVTDEEESILDCVAGGGSLRRCLAGQERGVLDSATAAGVTTTESLASTTADVSEKAQ